MDSMGRILKGLLRQTEEGKLQWRTSADGKGFVAAVDAIAVSISSVGLTLLGNSERLRLEVVNEKGITVEALEFADISAFVPQEQRATNEQVGDLKRLFTLARRSALDTNSTLQKLAESLENAP